MGDRLVAREPRAGAAGIPGSYGTFGSFPGGGSGWLFLGELPWSIALLRTSDDGETWTELPTPLAPRDATHSPELLEAIGFADGRSGILLTAVFDDRGSVARSVLSTRNGGESWERSVLPSDFHPLALSFVP